MKDARRFVTLFPGKSSNRLSRDLRTEYGYSFSPSFRFGKDVDGLVDRTMPQSPRSTPSSRRFRDGKIHRTTRSASSRNCFGHDPNPAE